MTNDTKLSDLTVGEFKALMRECLQQDMDAEKEVEKLRGAFNRLSTQAQAAQMNMMTHGIQFPIYQDYW